MLCSDSICCISVVTLSYHYHMYQSALRLHLDVLAALWAQDIVAFGQEATTDQGHGALLAVEAVIVPLALLEGNVLAASEA